MSEKTMDNREQKVRDRIAALEAEIEGLSAQIEEKRAEQSRFQTALDVWLSVDVPSPPPTSPPPTSISFAEYRFRGKRFLTSVEIILRDGPQSTSFIHDALVAGGFVTEAANFRSVVSNMLNEAAKSGRLIKTGERLNATWSLRPPLMRGSLTAFLKEEG
jgi:hypothetical protein